MSADLQFSRHSSRGWLALWQNMCWVSTFSFRDSEKALDFSLSPYDIKGVDRTKNDAERCEIQFPFQKYTFQNDSTNNNRVIKKNYTIRRLRTPGLSHLNLVCPVTAFTQGRDVFCVFTHGQVGVRTRYPLVTFHRSINWAIGAPDPIDQTLFQFLSPVL